MGSPNILRRAARFTGVDRAVAYVILARTWSTLAGVITLYAIVRFLLPDEQGFYYTFSSVLGIQIFFELGFSYTLMQCVSHEKAHLVWTEEGTVEGNIRAKHRLAALLKVALRWYGVAALLFFAGVLPAGLMFFQKAGATHPSVSWRVPWIWLAVAESIMLFVSPFFVFLEGAGLVARVALVRLVTSIMTSFALWLALWRGWALLASPIVSTVGCICGTVWIAARQRRYFADLLRTNAPKDVLNWRVEVWPFQWRITVSWLSGYFLSQLAIPVLFRFQGPATAGQMGLSTSLVLAAQAVGLAWVSTKAPQFGAYVAKGEFDALDRLFFRTIKQAYPVLLLICTVLVLGVLTLNATGSPYRLRVLPPLPFLFMVGKMLVDFGVYFVGVYLRAHKQEPLMVMSVAGAVITGGTTYFFGRFSGALGVTAANFAFALLSIAPALVIFQQKRRLWHAAPLVAYAEADIA